MATDSIKTIYSNSYPGKKFYSNERSGFSTATEAVYYLIKDLQSIGAMRLVNVKITDEGNNTVYTGNTGNFFERTYRIVNPGSGYYVGDKLQLVNAGNGTPLTINVTAVSTTTSGITEFEIVSTNPISNADVFVNYTDISATQPNPLQYADELYKGVDPAYFKASFTLRSNVINSTGFINGIVPQPRSYSWLKPNGLNQSQAEASLDTYKAQWEANFGYKGGGGILGDRHPDGAIVIFDTADEIPTGNTSLKVGQYIFLVDPTSGNVQANTRIKTIASTKIISTIKTYQYGSTATEYGYIETTSNAYVITLDKAISANIGAQFVARGDKATIDNSGTTLPRRWVAVLESLGACDPLSDYVGVTGNVVTAVTNSNQIQVTELSTGNVTYNPMIYVGQSVTNTNNIGAGVGNAVTVSNVTMTSLTTATVTLSSNQTIAQGKNLKFLFDPIQPWRLCIEAQDHQMVNIMAGTGVQFDDSCSIPRYLGNVAANEFIEEITSITATVANGSNKLTGIGGFSGSTSLANIKVGTTMTSASSGSLTSIRGIVTGIDIGLNEIYLAANVVVAAGSAGSRTFTANVSPIKYSTLVLDTPGLMGRPLTSSRNERLSQDTYQVIENIGINEENNDEGFINRKKRVRQVSYTMSSFIKKTADQPDYGESYPINTQLTVTDRGIFFGAWEGNFSTLQKKELANNWNDNAFSWFLIQRPVDRITGRILTTGRCPLFCINSVGFKYHKFIVRESDIFHPTQGPKKEAMDFYSDNGVQYDYRTPADQNSVDSFAILNTTNQIALTEDSKFLVSFLHNLTSPRFRYSEELDMLGQTSADVCISGNDLSITAYQESGPRKYKALPSNKPYNTGLRIVVLKDIP